MSSSDHEYKYDVFFSFRGEDTRKTFTAQLHQALCKENIETYIDCNLKRGNEAGPALKVAINQSRISIVVFSENYANSKWCLTELAQIMECRRLDGQVVIPVFYEIDPSNVRKQKGSYETAFARYETEAIQSLTFKDRLIEWKAALTQAANISGWESRNYRDDSQLVNDIVKDVWKMLSWRYPNELKHLIENYENNKQIESLFKKHQRIGIWGLAGMGKATIAKNLFAKHFAQYDRVCLLQNVREDTEMFGLSHIRNKLFNELLRRPTSASEIVGCHTFIKRSLSGKKVLIVLDDVDDTKQLEDLCSYLDELRSDSRLIITTSDKHLLDGRVDEIYEIKKWKFEESLKLFSFGAFNQEHVKEGYEILSKRAVAYAGGIPLALKVLGLHFYSREPDFWDSELKYLENNGRDRAMTEGTLQVMKALGVGIAMNHKSVEKDSLAAKVAQLEGDLSNTRKEHSAAITEKDNELKALRERVVTDQKTLSELQGKVKDLEAAASDTNGRREDERPNLQELDQAGMIAKLEMVEKAMPKMVRHDFESAVEQMKVINPGVGLVTEGIHFLKSVEEGQLITPPNFEESVPLIENANAEEATTEEAALGDN